MPLITMLLGSFRLMIFFVYTQLKSLVHRNIFLFPIFAVIITKFFVVVSVYNYAFAQVSFFGFLTYGKVFYK